MSNLAAFPITRRWPSNESWTPEFLSLKPDGKVPAIIDPDPAAVRQPSGSHRC